MPTRYRWGTRRLAVIVGVAAVVLGVVSTLALAGLTTRFAGGRPWPEPWTPADRPARPIPAACAVPTLPGSTIEVTSADMGAMMRGYSGPGGPMDWGYRNSPNRNGSGQYGTNWYGPNDAGSSWPGMGMGRMALVASPARVVAGQVSVFVNNIGWRTHELVVLPLAAGQSIGERAIGSDGKIDESASLGEASRSCGPGAGDGIAPGANSWITLALRPGRYELVCNLPGHYAAGMYTELDVTS